MAHLFLYYAFDWVKSHYTYNKLEDLYDKRYMEG